jgi:hypothetical protein
MSMASCATREIYPEGGSCMPFGTGRAICETSATYRPRNPEETVLYGIVAGHLETYLARQRE